MSRFMEKVEQLRWDDHRYYHQSRINQSLHLVSALSFLAAYAILPFQPAVSGLIGWLVGMVTRQSGHVFFEPRGYDAVNQATDEYKEAIKAGYNMRRKAILLGIWVTVPALLTVSPSRFGLLEPRVGFTGLMHVTGLVWLALAIGGVLFRTIQLSYLKGPSWGAAWATKILTDPFHNVAIYWRSPWYLMRGQLLDPIEH